MSRTDHPFIADHPDRASFFKIISQHYPRTSAAYALIEKSYNTAKEAFKHQYRDSGERYFEHLRRVALRILLYLRQQDAEIISAALLHDIIEDIEGWPEERLAIEFSPKVAELVFWVTKPPISEFDGDKEKRNRAYHERLRRAPREALIIKLSDRWDNVEDLWDTSKAKRERKIRETQDFYLPLCEREILLVHELEAALDDLLAA